MRAVARQLLLDGTIAPCGQGAGGGRTYSNSILIQDQIIVPEYKLSFCKKKLYRLRFHRPVRRFSPEGRSKRFRIQDSVPFSERWKRWLLIFVFSASLEVPVRPLCRKNVGTLKKLECVVVECIGAALLRFFNGSGPCLCGLVVESCSIGD